MLCCLGMGSCKFVDKHNPCQLTLTTEDGPRSSPSEGSRNKHMGQEWKEENEKCSQNRALTVFGGQGGRARENRGKKRCRRDRDQFQGAMRRDEALLFSTPLFRSNLPPVALFIIATLCSSLLSFSSFFFSFLFSLFSSLPLPLSHLDCLLLLLPPQLQLGTRLTPR